jgi:hypothetical protein
MTGGGFAALTLLWVFANFYFDTPPFPRARSFDDGY